MSVYQLTVTVNVEAMHLFPAIIKVEDALKKVLGVGFVHTDWDRNDPRNIRDFEGAKALLEPVHDDGV